MAFPGQNDDTDEAEYLEDVADDMEVEDAPPPDDEWAFVPWRRQLYKPERIDFRREAEDRAIDLLNRVSEDLTPDQLRELSAHISTDWFRGKVVKTRFRPAFMGATLNTLIKNIETTNAVVAGIWRGEEQRALETLDKALKSPKFAPGVGRSFPSTLMYLRDREKYAVWIDGTDEGLRILTPYDGPGRAGGTDAYLHFSQAVGALRERHDLRPQEVDLVLSKATQVAGKGGSASLAVEMPDAAVDWFAKYIDTHEYENNERGYKITTHKLMSKVLAPGVLNSNTFPETMSSLVDGTLQLSELGVDEQEVIDAYKAAGFNDVRQALLNLSGGPFGWAQYLWIPRAVEYGLGDDLQVAFQQLLDSSRPLAGRIDQFRDELYETQKKLESQGGFLANWTLMKISLSFVASILGAYDPNRYVFYAATRLREAFADFSVEWPKGTNGQRYEKICRLAQQIFDQMTEKGVPVRDLIDVQSFLYLWPPSERPEAGGDDLESQAKVIAQRALWPEDRARTLVRTARASKQMILYGPPGTGKTWVAKALADVLAGEGEGHVELVQFHPSYAYEDFIEGIRPRLSTDADQLSYELRRGVFMRLVNRAREFPKERFVLIVDEINRANLPRVFGELLYGLEYRGAENPISLPYSDTETYVPTNLWIIGTMNTADRSVALMDAALRRRFRHVHLPPDPDVLRAWLQDRGLSSFVDKAITAMTVLNAELLPLLGEDMLIGHSYFMTNKIAEDGMSEIWEADLEPVLREHLYSRPAEVERLRKVFLG